MIPHSSALCPPDRIEVAELTLGGWPKVKAREYVGTRLAGTDQVSSAFSAVDLSSKIGAPLVSLFKLSVKP